VVRARLDGRDAGDRSFTGHAVLRLAEPDIVDRLYGLNPFVQVPRYYPASVELGITGIGMFRAADETLGLAWLRSDDARFSLKTGNRKLADLLAEVARRAGTSRP
jgi:hypothetical protein